MVAMWPLHATNCSRNRHGSENPAMSSCRLIQSRAQRPVGLGASSKPQRKHCVSPASAVGNEQQGDAATPPAQPVGTQNFEAPPAYPLYQPQAYQPTAPVAAPPPPPAPVQQQGGTPFWVWMLVGAAAAWVFGKIQDFRKNPAAAMLGMMGSMNKGNAGAAGGNDMAAMMEMMKKMQGTPGAGPAPGFGGQPPFGGMGGQGMTIPTTAQEIPTSSRDGSKFEQNKQAAASPSSPAESTPAQSTPASTTAAAAAPTLDASAAASTAASSSFFSDSSSSAAAAATPAAGAASPASTAASSPSSFFSDAGSSAAGAPGNAQGAEGTEQLIENMLEMVVNNPELQQQMNKFLPENMRNESTWKWIANSPELRKQIAAQMAPNFNMNDFQSMATGDAGSSDEMKKVLPGSFVTC